MDALSWPERATGTDESSVGVKNHSFLSLSYALSEDFIRFLTSPSDRLFITNLLRGDPLFSQHPILTCNLMISDEGVFGFRECAGDTT